MADDKKQKTLFLDDPNAGAAPHAPSAPLSSQSTMMMEAAQPGAPAAPAQRQMVVPTMMKQGPQGDLPPMQRPPRPTAWGRWVVGPIISALVAAGTVYGAGILLPKKPKPGTVAVADSGKPQGKLRISTDPPGASMVIDGKRFPHYAPWTIQGDVGATLKIVFQFDGYRQQEQEVYVAEGEHAFNVKLESLAPVAPAPVPEPVAPVAVKKEHEHHHTPVVKEPEGKGKLSVLVRPWAIVYLDNQKLKQTPVNNYEIKSGKHVVELVNELKNRREKIELNLKPGETQELKRDWDK